MGQRQSGEGSLVPPSGDDCRAASLAWRHSFWWRPPQKVAVQSIAVAAHLLDAAYRSAAVQRSRGEQRRPATGEMPLKKPGGASVGRLNSETSRILLAFTFYYLHIVPQICSIAPHLPSAPLSLFLASFPSVQVSPCVFDEPSGACRTALRGLPH